MRIKYRCSHCDHVFELEERQFHRCPNCFWTTSLEPLEEIKMGAPVSEVRKSTVKQEKPTNKSIFWKLVLWFVITTLVAYAAYLFYKHNHMIVDFGQRKLQKTSSKSKATQAPDRILNAEELKELGRGFQITIPRKLSEDEEEILKKQVSSPAKLSENPKISEWKKAEFEKLLESEQKQKKITLGWWYVHSLVGVFENHYPQAIKAFEGGDYVLARELFIRSLAFPTYQNNVKLHRAVALVMLRSYINDVIGKIAVINQYLLVQSLLTDANSIFGSYQAIFPVLELQEWDRALQIVTGVKKQIEAFEGRPQNAQVNYPSAFGQIDAEIQSAIQTEAAPKPEAAINLKALKIDLDLKEKVIRQNTAEELLKVQKQYEQALKMIEDLNWEVARDILETIESPPELASDARKRLALIEKILAAQEASPKK